MSIPAIEKETAKEEVPSNANWKNIGSRKAKGEKRKQFNGRSKSELTIHFY